MRYILEIRDGCVIFDGIGKLKLNDVIISTESGSYRADALLAYALHDSLGKPYPTNKEMEEMLEKPTWKKV